ncbi:MAG: VC0807 family protein, partial [Allobranchiibius sp.]
LVYLVLHAAGLSNLLALACGAGVSALIALADMAWHRRVNALALIVLLTLVLAVIVSLISGNARVTLARDCVITGGLGLVFLGSLTRRRPLVFHLLAPLVAAREPGGRAAFDRRFEDSPELRSALRVTTAVWGVVLLGDAALRLLAVLLLPVTAAATAATALTIATVVILVGWLRFYLPRRVRTPATESPSADVAGT